MPKPSSIKRSQAHATIVEALATGPATSDELAAFLGLSVLSIRPRLCELYHTFDEIEPDSLSLTDGEGRHRKRIIRWRLKNA